MLWLSCISPSRFQSRKIAGISWVMRVVLIWLLPRVGSVSVMRIIADDWAGDRRIRVGIFGGELWRI